jgi:hypothetical protein
MVWIFLIALCFAVVALAMGGRDPLVMAVSLLVLIGAGSGGHVRLALARTSKNPVKRANHA